MEISDLLDMISEKYQFCQHAVRTRPVEKLLVTDCYKIYYISKTITNISDVSQILFYQIYSFFSKPMTVSNSV